MCRCGPPCASRPGIPPTNSFTVRSPPRWPSVEQVEIDGILERRADCCQSPFRLNRSARKRVEMDAPSFPVFVRSTRNKSAFISASLAVRKKNRSPCRSHGHRPSTVTCDPESCGHVATVYGASRSCCRRCSCAVFGTELALELSQQICLTRTRT